MYAKDNTSFIIGITGNIATGKSVILRMLANTGALAIDADTLAHRMLYPGGPAYQPVIDAFGSQILTDQQMISNQKLGEIVFQDPKRLKQLEGLVHPPVIDAIHKRIKEAKTPVVAIEAIKLLESGLADHCDQIWVSHADFDHQVQRLVNARAMKEEQAKARINMQPPQANKLTQADAIINTEGSFKDTWERTQKALNAAPQSLKTEAKAHRNQAPGETLTTVNNVSVSILEASWQELSNTPVKTLYTSLGTKKVIPVISEAAIQAFVILEDWNFTAVLEQVHPMELFQDIPTLIFDSCHKHAQIAQTEILLVADKFIREINLAHLPTGFSHCKMESIIYPAWRTAVNKAAASTKSPIWLKVLAQPYELAGEPIIE